MNLVSIGIIAGVILVALFVLGLILTRLYRRASKEVSFVRTGFGGEKVIMNGGAMVLPVLHEIIPVNMNTLRLEVRRAAQQALITRDRMRVDVMAEFYVRVKPSAESIATAAQTLGMKTMSPDELKDLVEGKFVDALRAVAAEMAMEELHEKRVDFVQKVQQVVSEDLFKNSLELETVSLTGLDQTSFEFFNPQNAFDAEGLTKLTETIEGRRKKRNEIEQDTDLAIKTKNLEAEQQRLKISREEEYAKLEQEREIAVRRAEQEASIAEQEAQKKREAEEKLKDELVSELTELSKVALPELLIEDQLRSIKQDLMQNLAYRGLSFDSYLSSQKFKDEDDWQQKEARPAAKKRVKAGLVLAELSKVLKIEVSREELLEQISVFKQQYGKDAKTAAQFDNPEVHRDIANRMITDKTVDKLVKLNS